MNDHTDFITFLSGERLQLAIVRRQDVSMYTAWINTPDINRTLPQRRPVPREEMEGIVDHIVNMKPEDGLNLGIWLKEPTRLLGNIGLNSINRKDRHAVLSMYIGEVTDRSKGYGGEAVRLMLDHAFSNMGLRKVWINLHSFNGPSYQAAKSLGFVEVGRQREHCFVDGRWWDWVTMELFCEDWLEPGVE